MVVKAVIAALAAVVLCGCVSQAYDGPRRARAEVAVLDRDSTVSVRTAAHPGGITFRFQVMFVDGKPAGALETELLPGRHSISIRPIYGEYAAASSVCEFEARAGRRYRPNGDVANVGFWNGKNFLGMAVTAPTNLLWKPFVEDVTPPAGGARAATP